MMLRKIGVLVAGGALVASLSACDFTADGHLECHDQPDGTVLCTGSGTGTPAPAPTTEPPPPTTEEPPPSTEEPPPADPNEGLAAATMTTAPAGDGRVSVRWTTERTDITGWYIWRDGSDTSGTGVWGTELSAADRELTFGLLRPGDEYTFTLVAHTAAGDLPAVEIAAVAPGAATPPPGTEPDDPPVDPTGTTAAERFGWGTPIAAGSDEFNYTGAPDPAKWGLPGECWPANPTVKGGRCASHNSVQNGYLRETGTADGKTGYVSSRFGQKYGRWEVRARVITAQPGAAFHPVLITWPDDDRFPQGGEYDYLEVNSDSNHVEAFMHHPTESGVVQDHYDGPAVDLSQWHNYGFEWSPSGLTGYVDGEAWFHDTDPGVQAPNPMHQTIQLDNFVGTSGMATVYFDADWARSYPLR